MYFYIFNKYSFSIIMQNNGKLKKMVVVLLYVELHIGNFINFYYDKVFFRRKKLYFKVINP